MNKQDHTPDIFEVKVKASTDLERQLRTYASMCESLRQFHFIVGDILENDEMYGISEIAETVTKVAAICHCFLKEMVIDYDITKLLTVSESESEASGE